MPLYFKNIGYIYELYLCNGCHDLMQNAMNFNVTIVPVKGNDYRIYLGYTSRDDPINIMKNSNLKEKN